MPAYKPRDANYVMPDVITVKVRKTDASGPKDSLVVPYKLLHRMNVSSQLEINTPRQSWI